MTLDTFLTQTMVDWLDFLWLPLAFLMLRKNQWGKSLFFILACIFTLRLQVELMQAVGQPQGFFNFMEWSSLIRGYVVYGFFILGFLILARWSQEKDPYVFIAASITVFMAAFCVSTFVMVL
jgi:hypothetical protein